MYRSLVYNRLKEFGFNPNVSIDGGACHGEWSASIRSTFPTTTILGVDANDWNKNGSFPHVNVGEVQVLSDQDGKEVIFFKKVEGHCTGDSLFRENTFHYEGDRLVEEKRVSVTLKTLCEKHGIQKVDLLKLDTQGSEIIIMNGLGEMLDDVEFIEIECSLVEWNIGGCMIGDVVEYLRGKFDIYEILEFHRLNDLDLIQVDILFQNKKSSIKKPI
jgi:FkbM family methyltransferase